MSEEWYYKVLAVFPVGFWLESDIICKNNDHICLFQCINTCWVAWKMFENLW